MTTYIAVIHKDKDSDYGVCFPDFPGCITAGGTIDEAKDMAQEALQGHVDVMMDSGDSLPFPLPLEEIASSEWAENAVAYFVVEVKSVKSRAVRFNATLKDVLLDKIDQAAAANGLTRSGFLALAAQHELQRLGI